MNSIFANLLRRAEGDWPSDAANLLLRLIAGGMLFWVHGVHKAAGGIAYVVHGQEWVLIEEIRGMRAPMPEVSAIVATAIQVVAPLLLIVGIYTRPAGIILAGILSGAILQNVLAERDPQLAVLYMLIALTLGIWGSGRYSLDARRRRPLPTNHTQKGESCATQA